MAILAEINNRNVVNFHSIHFSLDYVSNFNFKFHTRQKVLCVTVNSLPFSISMDLGTRLSPIGGEVEAPWLECESRWRMVWLMKNRQRPTGED